LNQRIAEKETVWNQLTQTRERKRYSLESAEPDQDGERICLESVEANHGRKKILSGTS